jgi:hypothetical protein
VGDGRYPRRSRCDAHRHGGHDQDRDGVRPGKTLIYSPQFHGKGRPPARTPNMICNGVSGPGAAAAPAVMNAKKSFASSGQAATHKAAIVKLASRTHEYR